jgi:hypothetical protein
MCRNTIPACQPDRGLSAAIYIQHPVDHARPPNKIFQSASCATGPITCWNTIPACQPDRGLSAAISNRTGVRYCERYDTRVRNKREGENAERASVTGHSWASSKGGCRLFEFQRRLKNDGIRPRNVASFAEPRSLSTVLRLALVLPRHDDNQSPRGRSSEVEATSEDR